MQENEINFKRERDFGELFNATFGFIRQEFKGLGMSLVYFVLPILLLASIIGVYLGVISSQQIQSTEILNDPMGFYTNAGLWGLLSALVTIAAHTVLTCVVLGYMYLYIQKGKGNFSYSEVWQEVRKHFFRVLGASIAVGFLLMIGFVLCILPGIYVGVSLSVLLPLMVIERKNFSESFSRSFTLVKTNFWMVLGVILIAYLLVYILSIFLSLPAIALGMKELFFNMDPSDPTSYNFGIGYYVVNAIVSMASYIVYCIPLVLMAFVYFSLLESAERPSLDAKIDEIA